MVGHGSVRACDCSHHRRHQAIRDERRNARLCNERDREKQQEATKALEEELDKHLENIKGFSEAKVQKLIDCCKKLQPSGFMSATEALDSRKCILKINSGATALNELLGGGFQSKSITEIHGEFRTGKSQLCHTLCVTTQMPRSEGGAEGKGATAKV